jgi:hypothetical protein
VILPNFLWKSGNPARPCRSSASKILWDDNFCSAISQSRELVWLRNLVVSVSPASRPLSPRKKLAQLHSTFLSTASTFLPNWNLLFVLQFLEIWTLCEARALGTSYADKAQGQLRRDNGFHHEVFHELTLVHREGKRRGSLSTFPPRLVIPAQAGIQVCSPPPLAWIPALRQRSGHAFAGMTECCVNSAYFGFFILSIIHAAAFLKEARRT